MTKALVLAATEHQWKRFLNVVGADQKDMPLLESELRARGISMNTPVLLLEGWERNKNYTIGVMKFVGMRFSRSAVITDAELDNIARDQGKEYL